MARTLIPALLGAAVLGTACDAPTPSAPVAPERVVLISIDTLRADHVGAYGAASSRTPVLDALAAEGVRFHNAIAPQPMTRPSHATLLTGLDPPRHGVRDNRSFLLLPEVPTLAERLRDAGFATAAVVSVSLLQGRGGFDRGFDHYDDRLEGDRLRDTAGKTERRADATVDAALAWLATAPDRFFLWVHLYDPHEPYDAPGRLRRWLAASPYDAEISFADAEIGRLVDSVRDRWPDGRTLFVVTADHGESLGEHGESTHALTVYDATQRVPLILAGSGLPQGAVVGSVVGLADVAPTLLGLAGAEPLPEASGRNLMPLVEGEDEARIAYVETLATQLNWGWSPLLGVRSDEYKYIRAPRPELYDLARDPDELHNVAVERPEVVARLDAVLGEKLAGAAQVDLTAELDPETRAQLEALGYASHTLALDPDRIGRVGGPDPKDHMHVLQAFEEASKRVTQGRSAEALEILAAIPGDFPQVHALSSLAALQADRPALSEHHARLAIENGLETVFIHMRLGNALSTQGKLDEAREAYLRARALDPEGPDPLLALGVVADRQGRSEQAEAYFRKALEGRLPSPRVYFMLAALLIEDDREAEARELLARLHQDVLEMPEAAARLALAEARTGRRSEALRRIDRALRKYPNSRTLLEARAYFGGG